jgi:hypothetical protein
MVVAAVSVVGNTEALKVESRRFAQSGWFG